MGGWLGRGSKVDKVLEVEIGVMVGILESYYLVGVIDLGRGLYYLFR